MVRANVLLPDEIIPVVVVQDSFKQLQLEIRVNSLSKHVPDFNADGSIKKRLQSG